MNYARQARILANYIQSLRNFPKYTAPQKTTYNHIGALFTDIVLQSGLNYQKIVLPRVARVLIKYPEAVTVKTFLATISTHGIEVVLDWRHNEKHKRMYSLIDYAISNDINTILDLRSYLIKTQNHQKFLAVHGLGEKTLDYTLKLLNFDTVAVDRHISSFVLMAGIDVKGYSNIKRIVEYAADFIDEPRSSIDNSIWQYMSTQAYNSKPDNQLKLELSM